MRKIKTMALMKNKKFKLALAALIVIVVALGILEITGTTHIFHKPQVRAPSKPITTLPSKTAPAKNPSTPTSGVNQGTADDKNGQVPGGVSNNPSQWATSQSGLVTVKAPLANATFKPGDTITGSASSNPVQYRLIDDRVGVISQGTLNVVNGNFTASVNFKPYAGSGRLDVFNVVPNGREINEVQVPVNF
jgi:hypothetical protein